MAEGLQRRAASSYGRVVLQRHPERLQVAKRQLEEYFAGTRREFDLTLDIQGTPFQRQVWQALTGIPYGETRSYKQIAEAIGNPGRCGPSAERIIAIRSPLSCHATA